VDLSTGDAGCLLTLGQTNVILGVGPLTAGTVYTLTVRGVTDQSGAANIMAATRVTFRALAPEVFITEFLADNTTGLTNADGAHSDWIELQNHSPFPVDLAGWRLTDDPANAGVTVVFTAVSNGTYTLQYTETLGTPTWRPLAHRTPHPTNRIEIMTDAPHPTSRFYRLVTPAQP